eukprot:GHVN01085945.1.p1 GENE.GHVN01085945.1~~GHVN01085945.1.p1  ORF type:complete len:168 (+),score=5.53 GHVN01085945.1:607-1110(+)
MLVAVEDEIYAKLPDEAYVLGINKKGSKGPVHKMKKALSGLARGTRFDISYAVGVIGRSALKWKRGDDFKLQRIYGYLKRVPEIKLGGDECCKSTTGWMGFLQSGGQRYPIGWGSKLQSTVATSTAEAETVAINEAYKQGLKMLSMVEEMMKDEEIEVKVYRTTVLL